MHMKRLSERGRIVITGLHIRFDLPPDAFVTIQEAPISFDLETIHLSRLDRIESKKIF